MDHPDGLRGRWRDDVALLRDRIDEHRPWSLAALASVTLLVTGVVGALAYAALGGAGTAAPVEQRLPRASRPTVTLADPVVVVHVSGSVRDPGVYRVQAGSRVGDVVVAAGGFAARADPDRMNLASVVRDGDKVHVPVIGETGQALATDTDPVIDVNRDDVTRLQDLTGIGPSLAAAIVEHRDRHGPFETLDDLQAVPGIGPATVDRLRGRARV